MKITTLKCDWKDCTESLEVKPGQQVKEQWISLTVVSQVTGQEITLHLGPKHSSVLRGNMAELSNIIPATS